MVSIKSPIFKRLGKMNRSLLGAHDTLFRTFMGWCQYVCHEFNKALHP